MKRIIIIILAITPLHGYSQKVEKYCEMVAIGGLFTRKVTISVDFGEEAGLWKDNRIKEDDGRVKKFNTVVDALNYLGSQNWKLVNAFPLSSSSGSGKTLHFYFKKEYDVSELAPETK